MASLHGFGEVPENVIIHDDRESIEKLKSRLDNPVRVKNRRYLVYMGSHGGEPVMLITTGMGGAKTAIVVDEIIPMGARNIIKLGTFGAIRKGIEIGDIFIPEGAIRADGVSEAYVKGGLMAKASGGLRRKAVEAAKEMVIKTGGGTIWSTSAYFPVVRGFSPDKKYQYDTWKRKAFGVEMECAALFTSSEFHGTDSLAILICNRDWETCDGLRKGRKVEWNKYRKSERFSEQTEKAMELAFRTIEKT